MHQAFSLIKHPSSTVFSKRKLLYRQGVKEVLCPDHVMRLLTDVRPCARVFEMKVVFGCESWRDFRRRWLSTTAAEGFTVNWLMLNTSFILLATAEGRNLRAQSGGAVWFFFDVLQLGKLPPSDENINYVLHSLLMLKLLQLKIWLLRRTCCCENGRLLHL